MLLSRAQGGDRVAIEALFERLLPRVRRIVALRMGCRERELDEREDLVQETLLDVFRGLGRLEYRHDGAFCHWLADLVKNNLRDQVRRRNAAKRDVRRVVRSDLLSDSVLGHDSTTPSRIVRGVELEEQIETALLALDERQRRVIELRKLCDLSFEEISHELGLSTPSSARSLFSRAMAALAEKL
jgi:RNA polymerase sigma-70 factor (ECF subfamily)